MKMVRLRTLLGAIIMTGLITLNSSLGGELHSILVDMEAVGSDATSDSGDTIDINRAYMGDTNNYLHFIVVYETLYDWGGFANVTIRNSNGEVYLIMAFIMNNEPMLLLTLAPSLEDPINVNESLYFVDHSKAGRVTFNYTEIAFYINWEDIGGKGSVDVIFWTGLPSYTFYDRMPDTGFITYSGVNNVDTEGYIDEDDSVQTSTNETIINSTTITSANSKDITDVDDYWNTTYNNDQETTSDNTNRLRVDFPMSHIFVIALLAVYIIQKRVGKK